MLVKVALLAAMLGLALFNTRQDKIQASGGGGVRAELVLGVVALAAAALLTGTPPSRGGL